MHKDRVPLHMPTYLMCWPDTAVGVRAMVSVGGGVAKSAEKHLNGNKQQLSRKKIKK